MRQFAIDVPVLKFGRTGSSFWRVYDERKRKCRDFACNSKNMKRAKQKKNR